MLNRIFILCVFFLQLSNCEENIQSIKNEKNGINNLNIPNGQVDLQAGICFIVDNYPDFPKLLKERLSIQLTALELERLVSPILIKKTEISFLTFSSPEPFTYSLTENLDGTFQFGSKNFPIVFSINYREKDKKFILKVGKNKPDLNRTNIISISELPKNGICLDRILLKEFEEGAIRELEVGSEPDGPPKLD